MIPGATPPTRPPSLLLTFLKIGGFVFVCGIVGPIFLVLGLMSRGEPDMVWFFRIGLLITLIDLVLAIWLSLASYRSRSAAFTVRSRGRQVQVRIDGYRQTSVEINDQPLVAITVTLPDGRSHEFKAVVPLLRIPLLTSGWLTGWWDEQSGGFAVDWDATAASGRGGGAFGGVRSPSGGPTVTPPTVTDRLTELDRLRAAGAISDGEYQQTRARILGSM